MKTKSKILSIAMTVIIAVSAFSVPAGAANLAAGIKTLSGKDKFDYNNKDNTWIKKVGDIKYAGVQVGVITGHFKDNIITDKVRTIISTTSLDYPKYAGVTSKTVKSSDKIDKGNAFSGWVTLSNNKAIFWGGVYVG